MTIRRVVWALLALALFPLFSFVSSAHAATLNITEIPNAVGEQLGTGAFAGGVVVSAVVILALVLPTALIARGKHGFVPELIMGFLGLTVCVAIGWLSYWVLLVIALLIAVMFAGTMRDWITGGR